MVQVDPRWFKKVYDSSRRLRRIKKVQDLPKDSLRFKKVQEANKVQGKYCHKRLAGHTIIQQVMGRLGS